MQEAFCGLYRRWTQLAEPERAAGKVVDGVLRGHRFTPIPVAPCPAALAFSGATTIAF